MPRLVEFHPDARDELLAAYHWYRERNPVVARRFLHEIEGLLNTISETPEVGRPHFASTRRLVCRRFPFVIAYRLRGEKVLVGRSRMAGAGQVIGEDANVMGVHRYIGGHAAPTLKASVVSGRPRSWHRGPSFGSASSRT
jgi:plasmid stabilization system protein ParE